MREFLILITEIMAVVILQTILETVFDLQERKQYAKVLNIACILVCYFLLIRYAYLHLFGEIAQLVNLGF
ncbi:MAG: hypothetical protein FWC78_08200 [Defluviitaleaceae bacterium]|nr:hypothetical protein [Defluviitaleaceae bacterium]